MKRIGLFLFIVIALLGVWVFRHSNAPATHSRQGFNKKQYSLNDPTSLWVVVNKTRPLSPNSYQPENLVAPNIPLRLGADAEEMKLRREAASALENLATAASKDDTKLMLASGYRSYNFQVGLYNTYVKEQGQAEADKQSARPGYSEHQTGLAADLEPTSRQCEVAACFANTLEGKWLAAHAYKYGFVIRYAKDKQNVTGYIYEPWHLRFVGKPLAQEMHDRNVSTLEEYFNLPAAPDYQ